MRRLDNLLRRHTVFLLVILGSILLTRPVMAAASAPSTRPAQATSAPAAGSSNIVLVEDPTLRIWGMSPRQLLHVSIGAIVLFNIIGWAALIYMIRRTARQRKEEDAAEAGRSP